VEFYCSPFFHYIPSIVLQNRQQLLLCDCNQEERAEKLGISKVGLFFLRKYCLYEIGCIVFGAIFKISAIPLDLSICSAHLYLTDDGCFSCFCCWELPSHLWEQLTQNVRLELLQVYFPLACKIPHSCCPHSLLS
jgi:hypothetical protein